MTELIGNESYLAIRDTSTLDYTSVGHQHTDLTEDPPASDGYAYHPWDPSADNLVENQTPIRSEGAQGSRGATDSRQGLLDNCGGDFTLPQVNFGTFFWPILMKHAFGVQVSSTVDATGNSTGEDLMYYRHFPATISTSFTADYLEVLVSRAYDASVAQEAKRFVGGRIVSLSGEAEVGGKLKITPTIVCRNTFATTRTVATTITFLKAQEAFFASPEITVDISGTSYGVKTVSWEMNNGFFADGGQDDHILGDRFRQDPSYNEDFQLSMSLEFREPQIAIDALQRAHTAASLTIAATANVFFTRSGTHYPAMKIHFPKIFLNESNKRYSGFGRIPHSIEMFAEKDISAVGDFLQAPIQLEQWNITVDPTA